MLDILNVLETSVLLKTSPRVILNMARRGTIPGRKIGREWKFSRSAIEKWLESGATRNLFEKNSQQVLKPVDFSTKRVLNAVRGGVASPEGEPNG